MRDFLARAQVLSAFRALLRATTQLHPGTANEADRLALRDEVRRQFERNREEKDPTTVRYLLAEARESLKFLGAGAQGTGGVGSDGSGSDSSFSARGSEKPVGFTGTTGGQGGGWYGAVSPSDERDVHGREGQGWPWARKKGGPKSKEEGEGDAK